MDFESILRSLLCRMLCDIGIFLHNKKYKKWSNPLLQFDQNMVYYIRNIIQNV